MKYYNNIVDFTKLEMLRPTLGKIVATSGGFDPIHPGHISCFIESKKFGDTLVVIVNGDNFLVNKKGKPFMDLQTRCQVVASIRPVDFVIPFEIENDATVVEALEWLRPHVFTKGGDRTDHTNIPEWDMCEKAGIELVAGIGCEKKWSSSNYLRAWGEFWNKERHG
ncbi:MAG TPA: adenylyltransferase/cytidyltransferase family protein [Anaerolineae bacterium]|nr:adenylyltransferase/cytidyltransferase family protein [Anaerolineae bacterium]